MSYTLTSDLESGEYELHARDCQTINLRKRWGWDVETEIEGRDDAACSLFHDQINDHIEAGNSRSAAIEWYAGEVSVMPCAAKAARSAGREV